MIGLWVLGAIMAAGLAWVLGDLALRVGGWIVMTMAVFSFAGGFNDPPVSLLMLLVSLGVLVIGLAMWVGGHWLYAFKHHHFRSSAAYRLLLRLGGQRLDPTRNWGIPVVSRD